ncbi:unnamed protein product [Diabrotica balteata]|uniref:Glutaredoxin domain-containing protein n=1 Tax=Diabrotica balteata TaxID=107213 RepID=A0A9N9SZ62_DIABA|nr:unnamed protein product [Diabrotica balteata]
MFKFSNYFFFKRDSSISSKGDTINSPKLALVKQMIKSDKIVIFSKSYCIYCKMVKELFDKCDAQYTEYVLDSREDGEEIQKILGDLTGASTVPRVFVNEKCLGGRAECKHLYDSGKLKKLLIF